MSKLILFYLRYKRKQRMFGSLADDIHQNLKPGNMVTKLIIVNVAVFVVTALLFALFQNYIHSTPGSHQYPCLPAGQLFSLSTLTFITQLHSWRRFSSAVEYGRDSIFWANNREIFLGDRRILPLCIFGGLISGVIYLCQLIFILHAPNSFAMGASGSIMAIATDCRD